MNLKRTAIISLGGAALAAWLSAAIAPARPPVAAVTVAPAPIDASGAALANEIARLRERLRPTPAPREATRNPFVFRAPRRAPVPAPPSATEVTATISAESASSNVLRLTLAGIAEEADPAGGPSIRTAIISGSGQLFLAKEGDAVTDGSSSYTVGSISSDGVDLTAVGDGSTRRLNLK